MQIEALGTQEVAARDGATHRIIITHEDLTEAVADTDQVIQLKDALAGQVAEVVGMKLVTSFEDESDAAFNSILLSIGETGGDVDYYMTATQVNENGAEVDYKLGTGSKKVYLADDTLDLLVESMAAKSLVNIDKGEAHILVKVYDLS